MDPAIFQFYLKRLPAEYAPIGSQLPPFEKVLDDLEHLHGRQRARDMGLVFLAQEILIYLLDGRVLPLATAPPLYQITLPRKVKPAAQIARAVSSPRVR